MDTQKNRLNETVLFSTQNICQKVKVRKYLQFYAENICLSKCMVQGDQDRQSTNVLEMMKMWREDLKVENEGEEPSAINGEIEEVNGPPDGEVQEGNVEKRLSIDELEVPKDSGSRRVSVTMACSKIFA